MPRSSSSSSYGEEEEADEPDSDDTGRSRMPSMGSQDSSDSEEEDSDSDDSSDSDEEDSDSDDGSDGSDSDGSDSDGSSSSSSSISSNHAEVPVRLHLESASAHLLRHPVAQDFALTCARCRYQAKKTDLQKAAAWQHPGSGELVCWLMEVPGAEMGKQEWGLGCCLCRRANIKNAFGKCTVSAVASMGEHKLRRHADGAGHLRAMQQRISELVPDLRSSTSSIEGTHGQAQDGDDEFAVDAQSGVGFTHVLKTLEMVHNQNSFKSFEKAMTSARLTGAQANAGNESRMVARRLTCVCAGHEMAITQMLLRYAVMTGISQDAKDSVHVVDIRMVLWKLPPNVQAIYPQVRGLRSLLPNGGAPWVVDRALGLDIMGADRSADATARSTVNIFKEAAGSEENFDEMRHQVVFFSADNAADETKAGVLLKETFSNMTFDIPDVTHSLQLAIKNGVKGDPEVDLIQGVFITNKKPYPSISNILRHSTRFRSRFTEKQQGDVFGVLSHLGWSPQRMSSRSRPYQRSTLKMRSLLCALAAEAEGGGYADATLANLKKIAPYLRFVLAGMMADLTAEHRHAVLETDTGDPDPSMTEAVLTRFEDRCRILFMEGQIMSAQMKNTFTAQVLAFYKEPQVHTNEFLQYRDFRAAFLVAFL